MSLPFPCQTFWIKMTLSKSPIVFTRRHFTTQCILWVLLPGKG